MSLHISCVQADQVQILTDGAVYDERGVVRALAEKITRIENIPAAVTTRGYMRMGERLRDIVVALFALSDSFDEAMEDLGEQLGAITDNRAPPVEMLVAGISEATGPTVFYFHNQPPSKIFLAPFKLHRSTRGFLGNLELPANHHQEILRRGGFERVGVQMMQSQREISMPTMLKTAGQSLNGYTVGGHVDLTTVTSTAVQTRRLHTWPDEIGKPISPFAASPNVLPLNRQARRAAARRAG